MVSGLDRVRVGDVLSLERRVVQVDPSAIYGEIGIRSFGKGIFHKEPVSGLDLGNKRVFRIEPGDLVISNVFAWEGAIAVASDAEEAKIGSHRFMTFAPRNNRIDTSWASWFFRSEPGLKLIRQASPGSAGRNRTLAIGRFENLEIPLPSLDKQRRVALLLDKAHAGMALTSDRVDRSRPVVAAMQAALTSPPRLRDEERAAAGWISTRLGSVLSPSASLVQVEPERTYMVAGIYSFGRGLIDRGPIRGFETSYRTLTRINASDVVVSKLNGWEGAVAVVDDRFAGYFVSSEYPTFIVDLDRLLPEFFKGIPRSPWFWDALNSGARGSMVRRRRISENEFLKAEVWLPSIETQQRAVRHLEVLDVVKKHRSRADEVTNALMPSLLNHQFADA